MVMEQTKIPRSLAAGLLACALIIAGCRQKQMPPEAGETITNSIGIKLVFVPAGSFMMGSGDDEPKRADDELQHKVNISTGSWIGATEVTQKQWQTVMGLNPSNFKGDDLPVEKVSWKSAVSFCQKLSEKESKRYRLPTEAEWEYACRAGAEGAYAGTGNLDEMGWYDQNSEETTHPAGTKQPNAWGVYDMHGNVSEWCADFYEADYAAGEVTDPNGPAQGKYRVIRGGSWSNSDRSARCAARSSTPQSYQVKQTGFRLIMEISQ
jgi:formylglycine-generating enzyme required for sulfatase activity